MPKILTEKDIAQTRDRILNAAIACFQRKGIHATTMKDISVKAKLSAGGSYNYFKGKDDIIEQIANRHADNLMRLVREASEQTVEEDFRKVLGVLYNSISRDVARLHTVLISEAVLNTKIRRSIKRQHDALKEIFRPFVKTLQAKSLINPRLESETVTQVLAASVEGLITQVAVGEKVDVAHFAEVVFAVFER